MNYYIDIFSPETYEAFNSFGRNISGFKSRYKNIAEQIKPGDKFICYMTKLSRWVGILEVESEYFTDDKPLFYDEDDPYIIRFRVKPIVWLDKNLTIPIKEDFVWNQLSFTKDLDKLAGGWTGKFRSSLSKLNNEDGIFLEKILTDQLDKNQKFQINDIEYQKYITQRIRRENGLVNVSIPDSLSENDFIDKTTEKNDLRESYIVQGKIAEIGMKMGFKIWIPNRDRSNVLKIWQDSDNFLLDKLPLNYDFVTIKTIEQIDVIWLRKRAIVRAFEVEHSTSIYSGLLRMADLLALQPNMDIRLHIIAPSERREKVFHEIQRPVFSLLDKAPLYDVCTYISYDSVEELSNERYLDHLSDSVINEYEEFAE